MDTQLAGKVSCETMNSLKILDESVLNVELIKALVLHILGGQKEPTPKKKCTPKMSQTEKVLRKELGLPPPPPPPPAASLVAPIQALRMTDDGDSDGAIIIFVDGIAAIREVIDALRTLKDLRDSWILPLHSSLSSAEQSKVFEVPPKGL